MNINQENTLLKMIMERNDIIVQMHETIEKLNKILAEKTAREEALEDKTMGAE